MMRSTRRGRFITFEGVDGAGKSTQIDALAQSLDGRSVPFLRTREPGGTSLGEALRNLMLQQNMAPLTETLLMFAARNEHVLRIVEPALEAGSWVLCDRFTDASYAYQGAGRGVERPRLDALAHWVQGELRPDLTVLVDLSVDEARRRRQTTRSADRFERESDDFFDLVRAGYLERARAEPERFFVVDGSASAQAVGAVIWSRVEGWLPR